MEQKEEIKKVSGLTEEETKRLVSILDRLGYTEDQSIRLIILADHLELEVMEMYWDIKNCALDTEEKYTSKRYKYYNKEYYVLTDDEAEMVAAEEDEDYWYEIIEEIKKSHGWFVANFLDEKEMAKENVRVYGRIDILAQYDSQEHEIRSMYDGVTYYIYRRN